jgi:AcrR family transcriptional regulator
MARAKPDVSSRREVIIEAAVQQFAKAGYDATTMRDIAALTGMLAGSLYYHFSSKEELFCAVHEESIQRICASILRAVNPAADPWTRLKQAASGYLESMLNDYAHAMVIVSEFPRRRPRKFRDRLTSQRNRFENLFVEIINELPLKPDIDRTYWRLGLLGMLAWTIVWYRPNGRDKPQVIAENLVNLLKDSVQLDPR